MERKLGPSICSIHDWPRAQKTHIISVICTFVSCSNFKCADSISHLSDSMVKVYYIKFGARQSYQIVSPEVVKKFQKMPKSEFWQS